MDGEYARFRLASMAASVYPLTFYDLDGNARALDESAEEVFYLDSLQWWMDEVTATLFDDRNDDNTADTGEKVWAFGSLDVSSIRFGRPIPMRRPKIITSSAEVCLFHGQGFIRGK